MTTHLRRKLALAAGLVCLATPVLSACGFDYATDRPNVIANGGYDISGNMRVLAARVVASADGAGVFIATVALNPTIDAATTSPEQQPTLTGLAEGTPAAAQTDDDTITAGPFTPIPVGASGLVNLADPTVGGIPVSGTFKAGDVLPILLTFSDGEKLTLQVPVVPQCGPYASAAPQGGAPAEVQGTGAYDCTYPSLPAVGD